MRIKVRKLFIDDEKEEEWLNLMAAQGWVFEHYFLGNYTFIESQSDQYRYAVHLHHPLFIWRKGPAHTAEKRGVTHIGSGYQKAFYRRKGRNVFDIYDNLQERWACYKHFFTFISVILGIIIALTAFTIYSEVMVQGFNHTDVYLLVVEGLAFIIMLYIFFVYLKKLIHVRHWLGDC